MAVRPDRTRWPHWYGGRDGYGRIRIIVGDGLAAQLDAERYQQSAERYLDAVTRSDVPRVTCGFCGGRIVRQLGLIGCEQCGKPPGSPLDKATAAEIVATLFRCPTLLLDSVERDEDGWYTIAFSLGSEVGAGAGAIETKQQWALWTKLGKP